MAKTKSTVKTVKQEAWGIFYENGGLDVAYPTEWMARDLACPDETVRPVTISWEVRQEDLPTFEDMKGILKDD